MPQQRSSLSEAVTDSVASWINKGFGAGPLETPPASKFGSRSILAVCQPGKQEFVYICS
jgi:hypothetical protein